MKRAIIVTGDRNWSGEGVARELSKLSPGTIVIHGDAAGADTEAHMACRRLGLVEVRVPYLNKLGRRGGPARNGYMLHLLLGLKTQGFDIKVLAFHPNLPDSRGTKDMVDRSLKKGVVVEVFTQ